MVRTRRFKERKGREVGLTFKLDIPMHQPNAVHPPNGFTQLAPYPTENALAYNEEDNISNFPRSNFQIFKTQTG